MKARELTFRIRVLVEKDDDQFHAYCPDLKGLHVSGETEHEALANAREAVCLYMESLVKHGHSIPVGVVALEEAHPSLSRFLLRRFLQPLLGRKPTEYVEDIQIPDCLAAA